MEISSGIEIRVTTLGYIDLMAEAGTVLRGEGGQSEVWPPLPQKDKWD